MIDVLVGILLVLVTLAGLFVVAAAVTAIWRSLHEQELVRLRRFRDDIIFEAQIAESISAETVARIAQNRGVQS